MSVVSLLGVQVVNNPAKFTDKYEFEITFECLEPLEKGTWLLPIKSSANQFTDGFYNRPRMEADLCRLRDLVCPATIQPLSDP